MHIQFSSYDLLFKKPFAIAHGVRTLTEAVYVEVHHENLIGYGEAAFPPYLIENRNSAIQFFEKINLSQFNSINDLDKILDYIFLIAENNFAAKAAVDIALHDLYGKSKNKSLHQIFSESGIYPATNSPLLRRGAGGEVRMPLATYTIGMGSPKEIIEKLNDAKDFKLLKIKLGGPFDKMIIETVRQNTNQQICVDANQGWTDEYFAVDMIAWLAEQNCLFVEQPLPKNEIQKQEYIFEKSMLPVFADEACQTFNDIEKIKHCYHGINIKLMKCGGLREAKRMIERAKELNLKTLIGCMSESSVGCSAAAQLAPMVDYADLDGPLLISNDPFKGITFENGNLILNDEPGIGVRKN
ncbi:MAG: dipeptide epimerase [Bacteroidia bacterium]